MRIPSQMIAAAVLALVGFSVETSEATPIVVPNFSFESPDGAAFPPAADWTGGGTATGVAIGAGAGFAGGVSDGTQYAFVNPTGVGTLESAVLGSVAANTTYTLTVALGDRTDVDPGDYKLELLSGGTAFGTLDVAGAAALIPDGTFVDFELVAATGAAGAEIGGDLTIRLTHDSAGGAGFVQGAFDNVRLDASPVPEPVTLILLVSGILGMTAVRRRRRL